MASDTSEHLWAIMHCQLFSPLVLYVSIWYIITTPVERRWCPLPSPSCDLALICQVPVQTCLYSIGILLQSPIVWESLASGKHLYHTLYRPFLNYHRYWYSLSSILCQMNRYSHLVWMVYNNRSFRNAMVTYEMIPLI